MSSFIWPASGGSSSLTAPCLIAGASSVPTGTLSGSYNNVVFPTVTLDTSSGYNAATGEYTIPSTGVYFAHAFFRINHTSSGANNILAIRFLRSGSTIPGGVCTYVLQATGITAGITLSHSMLINCTVASQTIRVQSYSEGGSPAYVSGSDLHGFIIYKVRD